jgi:hypothetical protein
MSSEKHPNLQLHKWAPTDYVKREEWNENFGIIDDKIGILNKRTENLVNVKEFGAKGDGITDDTIAIQNAIEYLKNLGGGILYFPVGVYIVDFVLKIDFPVKVKGDGAGASKIKVKDQSTLFHNPNRTDNPNDLSLPNLYRDYHAVFFFYNTSFSMEDIEIDGNAQNQTDVVGGVSWNYVAPNIGDLSRNYYKYFHGIQVKYDAADVLKITIRNCHIHHFPWNTIAIGNRNNAVSKADIKIYNNTLESASEDILSVHKVDGVKVYDNILKNPNSHGIHIYYNVRNAEVYDNKIVLDNDYFNFTPNDPSYEKTGIVVAHSSYEDNYIQNVNIRDNFIRNLSSTLTMTGISLARTISDISVKGNKMESVYRGIMINNPIVDGCYIEENKIYFLNAGIIFRPTGSSGSGYRPLTPSVPRPYKSTHSVKRNNLISLTDNTKSAIDLFVDSSVNTSEIAEYNIEFYQNETNSKISLIPKDQFSVTHLPTVKIRKNVFPDNILDIDDPTTGLPYGWLGRGNKNQYITYQRSQTNLTDVDGVTKPFTVLTINSSKDPNLTFDGVSLKVDTGKVLDVGNYTMSFFAKADEPVRISLLSYFSFTDIKITNQFKYYELYFTVDPSVSTYYNYLSFSVNADVSGYSGMLKNFSIAGLKLEKTDMPYEKATPRNKIGTTLNAIFGESVINLFSTAPPTYGTWKKGDKIWNSNPTAGGYLGWVCVADGTPGTWKGFGLIQS